MSEELRHRFRRQDFYALLFAFFSVSMTFVIFTSTAVATITCSPGSFVTAIGTSNDSCGVDNCPATPSSPCWTKVQSATASCTIPVNQFQCNSIISFSPAYSIAPYGECNNPTTAISGQLGVSIITFLATDPPVTWNGMPITATEIFGNTNHEYDRFRASAQQLSFGADVISPSSNASAILKPQYSTDAGVTWFDVGPSISIASAGVIASTYIAGNIPVGVDTRLRVVGVNGAGVADTPSFTNIWMGQLSQVLGSTISRTAISTTTITCNVRAVTTLATSTVVSFTWWAGIKA